MDITFVRAFQDNYIWVLRHNGYVALVDPGDANPVFDYFEHSGGQLCAILLTHHHPDHMGGVAALTARFPVPVYGPAAENIPGVTLPLNHGDRIRVAELDAEFDVIDIGGHTLGHIAYYRPNTLFCGDTLFAGGCGRLFEGTPQQMWRSLSRLAALPAETLVYCAHEYTQSNLRFALAVEPDNVALQRRASEVAQLRAADRPTVPSSIEVELATNPFLRVRAPAVVAAAKRFSGTQAHTDEVIFAAIRAWKDVF